MAGEDKPTILTEKERQENELEEVIFEYEKNLLLKKDFLKNKEIKFDDKLKEYYVKISEMKKIEETILFSKKEIFTQTVVFQSKKLFLRLICFK